jgi:hypothetical protein
MLKTTQPLGVVMNAQRIVLYCSTVLVCCLYGVKCKNPPQPIQTPNTGIFNTVKFTLDGELNEQSYLVCKITRTWDSVNSVMKPTHLLIRSSSSDEKWYNIHLSLRLWDSGLDSVWQPTDLNRILPLEKGARFAINYRPHRWLYFPFNGSAPLDSSRFLISDRSNDNFLEVESYDTVRQILEGRFECRLENGQQVKDGHFKVQAVF